MWFHDHAADMTAVHVARGLTGTAPNFDDLECGLLATGVLPGLGVDSDFAAKPGVPGFPNPYDVWLGFGDAVFHPTGALWYDSNNHNGYLGNVETVNGKAYPFMEVEARKYRFRFHGASTARHRRFRLSNNATFLRIGNDAWLFPKPQKVQAICLSPGKRADVVIDFSQFRPGTVIYLENILPQTNERGPDGELDDAENPVFTGTPAFKHQLLKFIVTAPKKRNARGLEDPNGRIYPNATITKPPACARMSRSMITRSWRAAPSAFSAKTVSGPSTVPSMTSASPTLAPPWARPRNGPWKTAAVAGGTRSTSTWSPINRCGTTSTGKAPWYHNSFKQRPHDAGW
jgi:hypothetical protein